MALYLWGTVLEPVRGFRSLVEVESTYWGEVKSFNTQNKLMDVHLSDISKILLCGIYCTPHLTGKCGTRPFLVGLGTGP